MGPPAPGLTGSLPSPVTPLSCSRAGNPESVMRQKINPEVNTRAAAVHRPKVVQQPRLTELLLQLPRKGAHVVGHVQGLRAWFEIVARPERELRTAIRRVGQIRDRMVRQVKPHHAGVGVLSPQQEFDTGL